MVLGGYKPHKEIQLFQGHEENLCYRITNCQLYFKSKKKNWNSKYNLNKVLGLLITENSNFTYSVN